MAKKVKKKAVAKRPRPEKKPPRRKNLKLRAALMEWRRPIIVSGGNLGDCNGTDLCKWVKSMSHTGDTWTAPTAGAVAKPVSLLLPIDLIDPATGDFFPNLPWLLHQQATNNLLIMAVKALEDIIYCGAAPADTTGPHFLKPDCSEDGGGEEGGTPPPPRYPPP